MPLLRWFRLSLVLSLCGACSVYDPDLTKPPATDGEDAGTCPPDAVETCNGRDDDCDGKTDEGTPEALGCDRQILHGGRVCKSGLCVWNRICEDGYDNCDGQPGNGCEPQCECAMTTCPDDDDDAGARAP